MRIAVSDPSVDEALGVILAGRTRVLNHGQRIGTRRADDLLHLLADFLERLVPRDGFERAFAVFLQRIGQAVFGIRDLRIRIASCAQFAVRVGVLRIADQLLQMPVNDIRRESAFIGTGIAQGVDLVGPPPWTVSAACACSQVPKLI